jgi:hypothetical protein
MLQLRLEWEIWGKTLLAIFGGRFEDRFLMAKLISDMRFVPCVHLTPLTVADSGDLSITLSQLIAYSQKDGFTRLHLTGGQTVDVKETTDRIDYLVRSACGSQ